MSDFNKFNKNGFIIKKQLFSNDEIEKLINFINSDSDKENRSRKTKSSTGNLKITLWNDPSNDLIGKFSTNERIVHPMQNFLGDEVSFYKALDEDISLKGKSADIASISSHAAVRFDREDKYPFCNKPLEYFYQKNF